jgi:hypothetical protein
MLATAGLEDGRGVVSIAGGPVAVLRDDPRVAVGSVAFSPDGRSVATARARGPDPYVRAPPSRRLVAP